MMNNGREIASLLQAICDATLKITQVGDLSDTLQRIVDASRELLSANYAVLATFAQENLPAEFVFSGISAEQAQLISHLPEGIGLLGAIVDAQKPIRLTDIEAHPQFSGFPQGHPAMKSFLGMPVMQNGEVYGRIYLADKLDDQQFTSTDEYLLQLFSSHAAVAIQNAKLIESSRDQRAELQQRSRQMAALDKATVAISGELTLDKVLQQIIEAARELADAEYAALGVPNSQRYLETFVDSGMDAEVASGISHLPKGLGL